MKRLRGCLGVFLIFFFGVIVGAALTGGAIWKEMRDIVEGGPDTLVAKMSERLNKDLNLDHTQKVMLAQIVTETRIKLRVTRMDSQPQVEEALADAEKRTRAILTVQQQKKFDEILKNAGSKWRARSEKTAPSAEKVEPTPERASEPAAAGNEKN